MTDSNPLIEFGGEGPVLHFAHANGFPPGTYRQFLQALTPQYHVLASRMRPLWLPPGDPEQLRNWRELADDLIVTLESDPRTAQGNIVAVGHSLGAFVSLIAATRRPSLFSALVLIEPAFLAWRYRLLLRLLGRLAPHHTPIVGSTLQRRRRWDSAEQAFEHFRRKQIFARLSDDVLWDYVWHGTMPGEGNGRVLTFDRDWEARLYMTVGHPEPWLSRCPLPALAMRGAHSNTLLPAVWRRWQALAPAHRFVEVPDAGHLLPLERPVQTAGLILDRLAGITASSASSPSS